MPAVTVVETSTMPWEEGLDVINAMVPEFRANLGGPPDRLEATYRRYRQKRLWSDPDTTRRIDLIHLLPGYADLTNAYHDSVEECFVLDGECSLSGEGAVSRHGYFWRPPGWVHSARTEQGLVALLSLEGRSAGDHSEATSRRIRPDQEAGSNALRGEDEAAMGPRGWVRCVDSRLIAWQSAVDFARVERAVEGLDVERLEVKVLSKNPRTGAQSLLLRLGPGYTAPAARWDVAVQWYVVQGSVTLGARDLGKGAFMHAPAGEHLPALSSAAGAVLFAKVDGWVHCTADVS